MRSLGGAGIWVRGGQNARGGENASTQEFSSISVESGKAQLSIVAASAWREALCLLGFIPIC